MQYSLGRFRACFPRRQSRQYRCIRRMNAPSDRRFRTHRFEKSLPLSGVRNNQTDSSGQAHPGLDSSPREPLSLRFLQDCRSRFQRSENRCRLPSWITCFQYGQNVWRAQCLFHHNGMLKGGTAAEARQEQVCRGSCQETEIYRHRRFHETNRRSAEDRARKEACRLWGARAGCRLQ